MGVITNNRLGPGCVCLSIAVVLATAGAVRADIHASRTRASLPSHFTVNDQYYQGGVWGLRSYLESLRATDSDLYAKLDPDLQRLESRTRTAGTLLVAGAIAGVGLTVYGIATRPDCAGPLVNDPDFPAKVAAWGTCNDNGIYRSMAFGALGAGALVLGWGAAMVIAPSRGELFDFMNRHNAVSPQPIRFQLGYDPGRRFALAGATFSF